MFGQQSVNVQGLERSDEEGAINEESTAGMSADDEVTMAL